VAHKDGTLHISGDLNANVVQLTREVEEYARGLTETERRIEERQRPGMNIQERVDIVEQELARLRDHLSSSSYNFEVSGRVKRSMAQSMRTRALLTLWPSS